MFGGVVGHIDGALHIPERRKELRMAKDFRSFLLMQGDEERPFSKAASAT